MEGEGSPVEAWAPSHHFLHGPALGGIGTRLAV